MTQVFFASGVTSQFHLDWLQRAVPGWLIMIVGAYFISKSGYGEINELLMSSALAIFLLVALAWKKSDLKTMLPSDT
jgi:hypothetical protein